VVQRIGHVTGNLPPHSVVSGIKRMRIEKEEEEAAVVEAEDRNHQNPHL